MSFSIRLTENEKKLAESYAKIHGVSIGEAMKKAFFDTIEDEYDISLAEIAHREFVKDPSTISYEGLLKELEEADL